MTERPGDYGYNPKYHDAEPNHTREAEEAVIAAAVNVVHRYRVEGQCTVNTAEGGWLVSSVDAYLRATRQPKAVKPEEVPPGTRFSFEPSPARPAFEHDGVYTVVKVYTGGYEHNHHGWLKDGCVYGFYDTDRIIPIEEPEE